MKKIKPGLQNKDFSVKETPSLFDNLPRLMRPDQVAAQFDVSIKTIYDWRHRGCLRGMPKNMFLSLNRRLFIRTDVFVNWIASQNPDLEVRE